MKPLSWRIWAEVWALPMIWRIIFGIYTLIVTGLFVKYLTEVFQYPHNSWNAVFPVATYLLVTAGALRLLRLKFPN
jgi:hypothetical protein